jgi:hypothetical protein
MSLDWVLFDNFRWLQLSASAINCGAAGDTLKVMADRSLSMLITALAARNEAQPGRGRAPEE